MKPQTYFRTHERDDGETEVEVEIEVSSWGRPAQTYGSAENCHPAEDPEVEILQAHTLNADGSHAEEVELTASELKRMRSHFLENPPEPDLDE